MVEPNTILSVKILENLQQGIKTLEIFNLKHYLQRMKITDIKGTVRLQNNIEMPYFGLGVYGAEEGGETIQAIHWALEAGYCHIDTASIYKNELSVGEAILTSGVDRKDIFITTKVWNADQGYQNTIDAFYVSLDKLKMDYLDLYLIHWPVRDMFIETWEALEELYERKLVKAVGVSNFMKHHLDDLIKRKGQVPMVNQMEFHPYLVQNDLLKICKRNQIQYQAWSPLMVGKVTEVPLLKEIGMRYDKTPAQIVLRWDLQKGVVTIPKSVRKERIFSNAEIFDFELTAEELKEIDGLDKNERIGPDPNNFNF